MPPCCTYVFFVDMSRGKSVRLSCMSCSLTLECCIFHRRTRAWPAQGSLRIATSIQTHSLFKCSVMGCDMPIESCGWIELSNVRYQWCGEKKNYTHWSGQLELETLTSTWLQNIKILWQWSAVKVLSVWLVWPILNKYYLCNHCC